MRSKIFTILAIIWAIIIFLFSAKTAEESTEDSFWVGLKFGSIVISDFEAWTEEEQLAFAKKVDHPIRKTAHATEYAIFAMLLVGAIYRRRDEQSQTDKKFQNGEKNIFDWKYRNIIFPWLIATFYAGTDEFHQLFVEGRSGQLSDVCLDSAGALVGVLIVLGIITIHQRKKAQ